MQRWIKVRVRQLRTGWKAFQANIYPFTISVWMAFVFAERLWAVQRARGYTVDQYENGFLTLVITWTFILPALVVDREMLRKTGQVLRQFLKEILWTPYLWVLLGLACLFGVLQSGSARSVLTTLKDLAKHSIPDPAIRKLLTGILVAYAALNIASRFTRKGASTTLGVIQELIASSYFLVANAVIYVLLYVKLVFPFLPSSVSTYEQGELFKDTAIYSLVVLTIVSGGYKSTDALRTFKRPFDRWLVFGMMIFGTFACAVPALYLDVRFKDRILNGGDFWYTSSQQQFMAQHVMFRDFALLVPLIVVAFLRLLLQIEQMSSEPPRDSQKFTRKTRAHNA